MASGSFSLSGLVNSLFGSNKKSRRRHICNSKCRHMKKYSKKYSNKYSNKYSRKRFSMRGG